MLYRTTLLSLLAIGVTNAFMTAPSAITRTSPLNLMSAKEIDYIMSEAEQCAAGECALDEVESLITNLQSQQSLLSKRIGEIDTLVKDLEHINGRDNRPVDEVKETVRAIFRVFSLGAKASGNDYPALSKPMGYSGETRGGGQTAYDVLPPRQIKK
ncbi:predicted protein [Thalassiosira pseudonana CCMP1335]|uniref:Uncharacterized protein n=1 Tax=Thalassiosira pseudonana TaxID=35128 RepID=B8C3K7_THAPS|nr:predicted protein [Thalassiosira pseudonana CCMP1335]EED92581.1 predicted protein [Thalassiosira pseudonana CCMP1335]|eukprot:g14400.t1 g14400   contig9:1753406-1754003(-)